MDYQIHGGGAEVREAGATRKSTHRAEESRRTARNRLAAKSIHRRGRGGKPQRKCGKPQPLVLAISGAFGLACGTRCCSVSPFFKYSNASSGLSASLYRCTSFGEMTPRSASSWRLTTLLQYSLP